MELNLTHFEPLLNETPFRVLSRHPSGLLVALQVLLPTGGIRVYSIWQ